MTIHQTDFAAAVLCVFACALVVVSLPEAKFALPAVQPLAGASSASVDMLADTTVPAATFIFAGFAYAAPEAVTSF